MELKDCIVGRPVRMNATIHDGRVGVIVDPFEEVKKAEAVKRSLRGRPIFYRPGLVAVFDPQYPGTLWWWFSPVQLERAP